MALKEGVAASPTMKAMKPFLLATDIGFILYWSVTLLMAIGAISLPPEWLFKDYANPIIYAWNWSFFPLDMVLSVCGLMSVRAHNQGHTYWVPLAAFSLALTFCAGFMAISFWVFRGDFDVTWWGVNLALMIWPLFFLPRLARDILQ